MYQLLVYFPGSDVVRATITALSAPEVLALIPKLLVEHEGCEHVVVKFNDNRLFAIDCNGNRLP